jgi:hypothetical protein
MMDWWVRDREEFECLGADARIQRHLSRAGADGLRADLKRYRLHERVSMTDGVGLQAVVEAAIEKRPGP